MPATTISGSAAGPAAVTLTAEEVARRDAFVGRVFESLIQGNELLTIYLGERLGLYRALAGAGYVTPAELAARAGTHERYTREWLEQQAAAGILEVANAQEEAAARRYSLPAGIAEALVVRDSPSYVAALPRVLAAFARPLPALLEAFRTGGGVAWADYGGDVSEVQAELNRPLFINLLATRWLPAIPDVHARLQADPPARVADIACGGGWSSITLAQAYPKVRVDGFDVDQEAITLARQNAAAAGVADRVTFQAHDATRPIAAGPYELVTVFEAVHDLSRPVDVLRTIREMLADGGTVVIADERVPESFTGPGTIMDRLFYATSVLLCLPVGLAEQPSAATGTVMRPSTLRRYAQEAGFRDVEVLPVEHDAWRFYRLMQ